MPRLLQIDSCLGIGSTGKIAEGIALEARNEGWETYMAHGARYIGSTSQIPIKIGNKVTEYSHYLNSLLKDNQGLNSSKATEQLLERIKELNPDIIHLHCIHGYYLNYEILFKFLAENKYPIVWTQHDCWGFTGHCSYFESIGCEKWKSGCHHCGLLRDYPKSIGLDKSARNWNLKKSLISALPNISIVSVSNWLDSLVKKSFLSEKPHMVIHNGIDTDIFQPYNTTLRTRYELENKYLLVAAATSWSASKGLEDYIKLSRQLGSDYQIVLVGLNKHQLRNIPSNIIALPRTNSAIELAEWYSSADIVLNLSYQETFGLTTIEGMACGTPGIVYNATASPELVTENTGVVVEPGNIRGVIDAIHKIKSYPQLFLPENCRSHVVSQFNSKKQYKKYIELYNHLLNTNE